MKNSQSWWWCYVLWQTIPCLLTAVAFALTNDWPFSSHHSQMTCWTECDPPYFSSVPDGALLDNVFNIELNSIRPPRSGLYQISSKLLCLSVISASTLTRTFQSGSHSMDGRPLYYLFVRFVAFVGNCRLLCYSRSVCHVFSVNLITIMWRWQVSQCRGQVSHMSATLGGHTSACASPASLHWLRPAEQIQFKLTNI